RWGRGGGAGGGPRGGGGARPPLAPAGDAEPAWREASGELHRLRGRALRELEAELAQLKALSGDGLAAAGAGYVFLISGDAGTGKSALAAILPRLFFGAGLVESSAVVDLNRALPSRREAAVS